MQLTLAHQRGGASWIFSQPLSLFRLLRSKVPAKSHEIPNNSDRSGVDGLGKRHTAMALAGNKISDLRRLKLGPNALVEDEPLVVELVHDILVDLLGRLFESGKRCPSLRQSFMKRGDSLFTG
jgi:hypothetical protein